MDVYVGFDSAWADNPRAPGAICACGVERGRPVWFRPPELASFADALRLIEAVRGDGVTLVALDQPTIVPNATGARPVERLAASMMSWLGGGVQPANTGRTGLFCAVAPIWRFLAALGAIDDPERAARADAGLFVMEVFPAMALATLGFFGPRAAPRYNPERRKTFRPEDWPRVAEAAAAEADALACPDLAAWCRAAARNRAPRKADQDRLDAAICLSIALRWRLRPRALSMLLGDLATGYIVAPASAPVRARITEAAARFAVPVDGVVPTAVFSPSPAGGPG